MGGETKLDSETKTKRQATDESKKVNDEVKIKFPETFSSGVLPESAETQRRARPERYLLTHEVRGGLTIHPYLCSQISKEF